MGNTPNKARTARKGSGVPRFSQPDTPQSQYRGGIFDTPQPDLSTLIRARAGVRPVIPDASTISSTQGMAEVSRREARAARRRREREQERARARRQEGRSKPTLRQDSAPAFDLGPEFDAPETLEEQMQAYRDDWKRRSGVEPASQREDSIEALIRRAGGASDFKLMEGIQPEPPLTVEDILGPRPLYGKKTYNMDVLLGKKGPSASLFEEAFANHRLHEDIKRYEREKALYAANEHWLKSPEQQWNEVYDENEDFDDQPFSFASDDILRGIETSLGAPEMFLFARALGSRMSGVPKEYQDLMNARHYEKYSKESGDDSIGASARGFHEGLPGATASLASSRAGSALLGSLMERWIGGRLGASIGSKLPGGLGAKAVGTVVGGALGMIGGPVVARGFQEWGLRNLLGDQAYDMVLARRQRDDEKFHLPYMLGGELANIVPFASPGKGLMLGERAGGAAFGGLASIADDAMSGKRINLRDAGIRAALGGTFVGTSEAGKWVEGRGEAAAKKALQLGEAAADRFDWHVKGGVPLAIAPPTHVPKGLLPEVSTPGRTLRTTETHSAGRTLELPNGQRLTLPPQRIRTTPPVPVDARHAFARALVGQAKESIRRNLALSANPLKGQAALENVLDAFDKAGAFQSAREKDAARSLWQARAGQWARETGRDQNEFYDGLQANLDEKPSEDALHQDEYIDPQLYQASREALKSVVGNLPDEVSISGTIADAARVGVVKLPSGATFRMFGGPFFNIENIDPGYTNNVSWASSRRRIADNILERSRKGANIQLTMKNMLDNVFASHGNIAIKAEIRNARGKFTDDQILGHLKSVIDDYNEDAVVKVPIPKTVDEFIGTKSRKGIIDEHINGVDADLGLYYPKDKRWRRGALDRKIWSFNRKVDFAKRFWRTKNGLPDNIFGVTWEEVAKRMNQPESIKKETRSILNVLWVDPEGNITNGKHPIYPFQTPGINFGLSAIDSLFDILGPNFKIAVTDYVANVLNKTPTDSLVRKVGSDWLMFGDPENIWVPDGIVTVPKDKILQVFHQEGEAGIKAWYDLQNRTMGAMTGKSDLSSFVHESWHDWTTSLKEEHTSLLEKHFGPRDSVEFQERGARAFERYLRDGYAPHPELRQLFETIKQAMVKIYHQVKGTPIEDAVHPEIRNLFGEVLGAGQMKAAPARKPQSSPLSRITQPLSATPARSSMRPSLPGSLRSSPVLRSTPQQKENDTRREERSRPELAAQLRQALAVAQSDPALLQRLKQASHRSAPRPTKRRARGRTR